MEEWRTCEGYRNQYEVSSLGKIRSLNYRNTGRSQELSQTLCGEYLGVTMDNKRARVHRVVGKAFLPNLTNLAELDHINKNKLDNRLENLRWVTKSENAINRSHRHKVEGDYCIQVTAEGTYRVDIRRQNLFFRKCYKGIEEARFMRDTLLTS